MGQKGRLVGMLVGSSGSATSLYVEPCSAIGLCLDVHCCWNGSSKEEIEVRLGDAMEARRSR